MIFQSVSHNQQTPARIGRSGAVALLVSLFIAIAALWAPAVFADQTDLSAQQQARQAEQPGNNAPVWRAVSNGVVGYTTATGPEAGVLINKSGETWRLMRNDELSIYGGWAVSIAFLGVILMHLIKGQIKLPEPRTGKLIERFTSAERVAHWTMAFSFIALALTGLLLLFGKHVISPVLGMEAFAWFAALGKNIHNFVGPLFAVSVVVFFLMYVKDNLPEKGDGEWLAKGGGLLGHAPAGRFNMGEKIWFWGGVTVLGITVSITGGILDFPNLGWDRLTMQQAHVIHLAAALIFMVMSFGHIYIGSIGMEGALEAMRDGYVDETWAKAHHELWYNDIKAGKVPAVRSKEGGQSMGSRVLQV